MLALDVRSIHAYGERHVDDQLIIQLLTAHRGQTEALYAAEVKFSLM